MKFMIVLSLTLFNTLAFSMDKPKLPPMPDPVQNSTLLGVDSDNDGIRDDVQIWIEKTFSNEVQIRLAMRQFAKAMQNKLSHKDDKKLSIQASYNSIRAAGCLTEVQMDLGIPQAKALEQYQTIDSFFNNTKERRDATSKASQNFSGQTYKLKDKAELCDFI